MKHSLLENKSAYSLSLFEHFVNSYRTIGPIALNETKSMIGIHNGKKNIAWITALGKNFLHVVFPFRESHLDNLCFQKIAQVPGDQHQFNHHLRILYPEDVNEEVMEYMKLAFNG